MTQRDSLILSNSMDFTRNQMNPFPRIQETVLWTHLLWEWNTSTRNMLKNKNKNKIKTAGRIVIGRLGKWIMLY